MSASRPAVEGVPRPALVLVAALAVAVVVLVVLSLRRPELPEFAPTPAPDAAAGPLGPGDHRVTVDASSPDEWRYVDLARGAVGGDASAPWDLAFRRFEARVNGGAGYAGQGGAIDLGAVPLDSVAAAPPSGYRGMEAAGRDTSNAVLDHWYAYSYTTHVLTPKDRTLALRTHDGRAVLLRFVSYYCPGAQPGCVTVRYRFLDASAPSR